MSWIRTNMKPVKICVENPVFPIARIFEGHQWELSGGTKQLCVLSAAFILALNVDTVVEIGLWNGFSSRILGNAIAANSRDGYLLSIDINPRAITRSKKATETLGITHEHLCIDSLEVDYQKQLGKRTLDFAFIDGAHDYEHAMGDMSNCAKILKPYGIMAVHDYSKAAHPDVYAAVNDFVKSTQWPMFYLDENRESTDYRSAIIQKPGGYV